MSAEEPIDEIRERLHEAQEAARRLAGEARRVVEGGGPPPQGWASPADGHRRQDEVESLVLLARTLMDLVPDELRDEVRELLRQLLVVLRAIVDWLVERLEAGADQSQARPQRAGRVVEDIPID